MLRRHASFAAATASAAIAALAVSVPSASLADSTCSPLAFEPPLAVGDGVLVGFRERVGLVGPDSKVTSVTPPRIAPTLPGIASRGEARVLAWRSLDGDVRIASLGDTNALGAATTLANGALADRTALGAGEAVFWDRDVSVAGNVVIWRTAAGHQAVRLNAAGTEAAGPPVSLNDPGSSLLAVAGDAVAAWTLAISGTNLSAQRIPGAEGPLPPAISLPGLKFDRIDTPDEVVRLVADGRGGAYLLRSLHPYDGQAVGSAPRISVLHLGESGATRPATVARAATALGSVEQTAGQIAARDGQAVVAFGLEGAGGLSDAFVRTVSATGKLGALRRLTRTRTREERVSGIDLSAPGRGVIGVGIDGNAAGIISFEPKAVSRLTRVSSARRASERAVNFVSVAATRGASFAVWGDDDLDETLARRVSGRKRGPLIHLAGENCETVE